MKKFVVSVGLVALGATGAQAGPAPSPLDGEGSRPWSVSMRLRGFYDDNINGLPDNVAPANGHRDTFGFEVAPRLVVSWPLEQTTIGFSYDYGLKYYQNRPSGNTENYDQTHTFMASLDHTFNERYQLSLKDSFVIGQEPDKLRAGNTFDSFQRIPGNNIRNHPHYIISYFQRRYPK